MFPFFKSATQIGKTLESMQKAGLYAFKLFIMFVLIIVIWGAWSEAQAVTTEEREYCLQQSYDAQQVAQNKLNGVPKEALIEYILKLPDASVPEGYKESVELTIHQVYNMEFSTVEEAQQKTLVHCINWHEQFGTDQGMWL